MTRDSSSSRFVMLGVPAVGTPDTPAVSLQRMTHALLGILALAHGPIARKTLAAMLWPDVEAPVGLGRLRRLLYRTERALPENSFASTADMLALRESAWTTDLDEAFAFVRAMPSLRDGQAREDARKHAAALARPLLDGVESPSPAFDEMRRSTELEIERMRLRLLAHVAQSLAEEGELDEAIDWAMRLVEADDLRESSHVLLMRLHARAGDLAAVESAYAQCAARIREEFGTRPSAATEAAWQTLSSGLASLPGESPLPGEIRFATDGAGTVAYREVGSGEEVLVLAPGFVSHIEIGLEWPEVADFVWRLAQHRRVLLFDRRGMGLSERLDGGSTVDLLAADLRTVLDAAGIRRAWILGASEGALGAVRFAAREHSRVRGLVLFGALARGSASDDYPHALPPPAFDAWLQRLVAGWGGPAGIETFAPSGAGDSALRTWWARLLRHAVTPGGIAQVLQGFRDADVREDAASIRCPTLVLHRTGDRAVRLAAGRDLAARIPRSRLVELDGDDHWWWRGDREELLVAIDQFLVNGKDG